MADEKTKKPNDADEPEGQTLDYDYEQVVGSIVSGRRSTHPLWMQWFYAKEGPFLQRVIDVFNERGYVPSPTQFYDALEHVKTREVGK